MDWSKCDWPDIVVHVIVAVLLVLALQLSPLSGALLVTVIFWAREASQRTMYVAHVWEHWSPLGWGFGSQCELYFPAAAAFAVAAIIQFW